MVSFTIKKAKQYKPNSTSKAFNPAKYEKKQESTSKMGYGKDWQIYRFRFLHHNPNCYVCGKKAAVVDHIKVHRGDKLLFEATNNHMPLCKKDHDIITGKFDRNTVQDMEGKMNYINNKRELNGVEFGIKVLALYRK